VPVQLRGHVEDVPPSTRDSGLLKVTSRLNPDTTAWAEYLITNYHDLATLCAAGAPFA